MLRLEDLLVVEENPDGVESMRVQEGEVPVDRVPIQASRRPGWRSRFGPVPVHALEVELFAIAKETAIAGFKDDRRGFYRRRALLPQLYHGRRRLRNKDIRVGLHAFIHMAG